ncbi:hypothetical protein MP228_007984 [Amoeboaphelidium protococcarum]|nr:hypothetical protein MP228_007984 [Amoeboaphelidium protococcarum]
MDRKRVRINLTTQKSSDDINKHKSQAFRVTAYSTCESIDMENLKQQLVEERQWKIKRWDEAVYATRLHSDDQSKQQQQQQQYNISSESLNVDIYPEIFFVQFGVVVLWAFTELEEAAFLESPLLLHNELDKCTKEQMVVERFKYFIDPSKSSTRILHDMIILDGTSSVMTKLAISMAIAQSVKLDRFEDMVMDTMEMVEDIPKIVATTGKVKMSRQESIRTIGTLFNVRAQVNLIAPILDTPDIFWVEPAHYPTYNLMQTYLEISNRVTILNQRALVIGDMLDMLNNFLNESHGESLEWVVIILIAISVVLAITTIYIKIRHFLDERAAVSE